MDVKLSPIPKKREVVLGITVQQALVAVEPINCHPPAPPVSNPPVPPVVEIDTSSSFATEKVFATREELIEWARNVAKGLKFSIVIEHSDNGGNNRKKKLVLGCERGGVYKPSKKKLKFEATGTRKCQCPFRLRGHFHATNDWHLTVVSGKHNHPLDKVLDGHLMVGRLKTNETALVEELTRNLVKPRNIMSTLRERDPENVMAFKQLYNARHRMKLKKRGKRSEMQHLFETLEQSKYIYKSRSVSDSTKIQDVFFANPTSVDLFNNFPDVLLMDSTYKTNRYNMPLFEMVGVTSTDKTFNVAFAFLSNEKEDNFRWAVQECQKLLQSKELGPKVVVTDRDTALTNVVAEVFPNATALVCRFHVFKNVTSKCKIYCKVKAGENERHSDVVKTVTNAFHDLLESPTIEIYNERLVEFRELCKRWPRFLNYVQSTVLDTDKEKVVRAWTNNVLHFGNTTTNRAESSHGVLKRYLPDGNGDFVTCLDAIGKMLINQYGAIKVSFGLSLNVEEHRLGVERYLYEQVIFKISRAALDFLYHEAARVADCGTDKEKCGCVIRRCYGLPCACVIAKKMHLRRPIRLDEVHAHWKKLAIEDREVGEVDDYSCSAEFEAIKVLY